MKLTKEQKTKRIESLGEYAQAFDCFEYGLPIYNEENMSKMREVIDEALEEIQIKE